MSIIDKSKVGGNGHKHAFGDWIDLSNFQPVQGLFY
jgi:hypothetical protein